MFVVLVEFSSARARVSGKSATSVRVHGVIDHTDCDQVGKKRKVCLLVY